MQIHTIISLILAVLVCGLAMWRGDQSARWIGAIFLANWLGSILVYKGNAYHADYGVLAIDVVTLAAFAWVSIRKRRIWTVIAAAIQAIIVGSHVATVIDLRVTIGTFIMSVALWSYGVLACIAFGTWAGWREQHRA